MENAPFHLTREDHRTPPGEILMLAGRCLASPIVRAILASLHGYALVMDTNRQLLAANETLLEDMGLPDVDHVQGRRPGEVLGCTHLPESVCGCGTAEACAQCGAFLTILASQANGASASGECWMTFRQGGLSQAREFTCRATQVDMDGVPLTVFVLQDISAEKRRDVYEHLFLHDLANDLQGLQQWTDLLQSPRTDHGKASTSIQRIAERIRQEVAHHRMLLEAEEGTLVARMEVIEVRDILGELEILFLHHPLAQGRHLYFHSPEPSEPFRSDATLLLRILINGVVNALEASRTGSQVTVEYELRENCPAFTIHNEDPIPAAVQSRVFQRSFSTKAPRGRGLGTYSMKLLGEDYLGGELWMESEPLMGTRFTLLLPPS